MVTLVTGEQVPSDSPEWLHECQARYILNMATRQDREAYLDKVGKRHGEEARRKLVATIKQLWVHAVR
jgi:hypothetical protein